MEQYLAQIFKELPFPCYMTNRLNETANCMVYNIIESPNSFCDDDEELTTYEIMIMLYCRATELMSYKYLVKNLLKKYKFKKVTIPVAIYDKDLEFYQQAMQYRITVDVNLGHIDEEEEIT